MSDVAKGKVSLQSTGNVEKLISENQTIYNEWLKDRFPNYRSSVGRTSSGQFVNKPRNKKEA